jgi:hypothetical protein
MRAGLPRREKCFLTGTNLVGCRWQKTSNLDDLSVFFVVSNSESCYCQERMSPLPTAPAKILLTYALKPEEDYDYKTLPVRCWCSNQRILGRARCPSVGGSRLSLLLRPFLILSPSAPFPFGLEEAWHRLMKLSRDALVKLVTALACNDSNDKSLYHFSTVYGIWCSQRDMLLNDTLVYWIPKKKKK